MTVWGCLQCGAAARSRSAGTKLAWVSTWEPSLAAPAHSCVCSEPSLSPGAWASLSGRCRHTHRSQPPSASVHPIFFLFFPTAHHPATLPVLSRRFMPQVWLEKILVKYALKIPLLMSFPRSEDIRYDAFKMDSVPMWSWKLRVLDVIVSSEKYRGGRRREEAEWEGGACP